MYRRKWTEMLYSYSLQAQKKHGLLDKPIDRKFYDILQRNPPMGINEYSAPKSQLMRQDVDQPLIDNLLKHYPELKFVPISNNDQPGVPQTESNYILNFVQKQKQFMKQGYSSEVAFERTEQIFQDSLQEKINQNNLTRGLAINNRARSFMTYYQQQAEYEGRLKVLRIQRDLDRFTQNQEKFQEELLKLNNDIQQNEEGYDLINEKEVENEQVEEQSEYTRVMDKIVNQYKGKPERKSRMEQKQETIDQFISRSSNMFKLYYQRAATKDRLSGLTDQQIKANIQDSPSKIKKRSNKLLKLLDKYNIELNSNGDLNYGSAPETIKKRLEQEQQMVKIFLMERDMQFEFPHREIQMERARELKQRLDKLEADNYKEDVEQTEIFSFQQGELSHQESNDNTHDTRDEVDFKNSNESTKQKDQVLDRIDPLVEETIYDKSRTYKLFETREERLRRVEIKWIQTKIKEIESMNKNELNAQNQANLTQNIENFRRVKFQLEQKAQLESKKQIFEEHDVFTEEELMVDADYPYERLVSYLNSPSSVKRLTQKDEADDNRIMSMIERREYVEDLVEPFSSNLKSEKDTTEYKNVIDKEYYLEERRKMNRAKSSALKNESQEDAIQEMNEESQSQDQNRSKSNTKNSNKQEKKKILEFIKKAGEKKQTGVANKGKKVGSNKQYTLADFVDGINDSGQN